MSTREAFLAAATTDGRKFTGYQHPLRATAVNALGELPWVWRDCFHENLRKRRLAANSALRGAAMILLCNNETPRGNHNFRLGISPTFQCRGMIRVPEGRGLGNQRRAEPSSPSGSRSRLAGNVPWTKSQTEENSVPKSQLVGPSPETRRCTFRALRQPMLSATSSTEKVSSVLSCDSRLLFHLAAGWSRPAHKGPHQTET